MNVVHKIITMCLLVTMPFAMLHAQTTKKKKAASTKTSSKKSSSKKKKKTAVHKVIANKKNEQTNAANPMGATLRLADKASETKDTTVPKVVTVTSAFKPSLRNAAKINFTAATPVIDSSKIAVTYHIPSQNLFFSYQPVPIKAIAYEPDSLVVWDNNQFIKVGYGNYASPYIEAGAAFGNPQKSVFNLHAKYIASNGNLPFQDFNKTNIEAYGIFNLSKQNELDTKLYYNNSNQYKYGYTTGSFTKDQLQQQFNEIGGSIGLQSKLVNDYGITYHPELNISYFTDKRNASELNLIIKAPINKAFSNIIAFDLSATADITQLYQPIIANPFTDVKNNLFYLNPTVQFKTPNFKLNLGVQPTWDNSVFSLLPNFTAEAKLNDNGLALQAGWLGSFQKNTYHNLVQYNPFIAQPGQLLNTKTTEQFVGLKGSSGSHFTYNAKFSLLKVNNLALLVNDVNVNNAQTFVTLYEPEAKGIKLHGEIGYTVQEKFFATASINYTNYTQLQQYDKAWGILPLELNGTLRYKITKDFTVKSDLFFWDGSYYRNPQTLASTKLSAAVDFNAGAEYTIAKRLNLWVQMNNVFNNRYQRWNQYEVLGFNVVGGIVYSFK